MRGNFRTERDSLGEKQVPAGAYYGVQTARAIENYPISGWRAFPSLVRAAAMIKLAAAETNTELGVLPRRLGRAIARAAREVIGGGLAGQFPVDVFQAGAGVSFHMNVNEVLANRAIELLGGRRGDYSRVHPNDHVNYGQSSNDVFPTAMRLAALLEWRGLDARLAELARALAAKGKEFDDVVKAGRTHMMDAVPVRLGQEFAAYAAAIGAARRRLQRAAGGLREIGLGGTAAGTGLNAAPGYRGRVVARLSEISRLKLRPAADLRAAMQSNLPMADFSGALRNLALELIRISSDLRLMASGPNTGLREIELPALQPGSSIMPGKINPVMPEMLTMVAFQVVGNDLATSLAVQAGQLELNVMTPAMAFNTLFSLRILSPAIEMFTRRCVAGITANRERCRYYAASTVSLAAALNPHIGYARAAEVAKESVRSGKTIPEIARQRGLLTGEQIRKILDPAAMAGASGKPRAARKKPKDA
jgi:aspartate ammonia-lyase